ncbi:MAG: hypothetical protein ABT20_03010 [Rubrivivax sp. SCN 70-15]|nr:MAG: hypothetical protein ABT20_03010 [Rubrivivax sp. SCN 70-15]
MNARTIKLLLTATLAAPLMALAAGEHGGGHGSTMGDMHKGMPGHDAMEAHDSAAGKPGDPAKVTRTVPVEMGDNMRFTPSEISVKAGETIRFFVVNKGKIAHEMVIGSAAELDEHAEMMRNMPGMKHAEPNQITLEPGKRGGIVWTFDKAGTFAFACLVPGHKEAGMAGKIAVN